MNIERWLRTRVFRIPARWNSVDDIVDNMDSALKQRGFEALQRGLAAIFLKAAGLSQKKSEVWNWLDVHLELRKLSGDHQALVRKQVDEAFEFSDELVEIEARLIRELRKGLKL